VVTSPSGAGIRDILHPLRDRFPRKVLSGRGRYKGRKCPRGSPAPFEGYQRGLTPGGRLPRSGTS